MSGKRAKYLRAIVRQSISDPYEQDWAYRKIKRGWKSWLSAKGKKVRGLSVA